MSALSQVVPADLNALLYLTARHISAFAARLGDESTAAEFERHAKDMAAAMEALMWCEADGCWHDLLLTQQQPSTATNNTASVGDCDFDSGAVAAVEGKLFVAVHHAVQIRRTYASNWVPLWCGLCEPGSDRARRAVEGLSSSGIIGNAGELIA